MTFPAERRLSYLLLLITATIPFFSDEHRNDNNKKIFDKICNLPLYVMKDNHY